MMPPIVTRIGFPNDPNPVLINGSKAIWAAFLRTKSKNPPAPALSIFAICENNTAWECIVETIPKHMDDVDKFPWEPAPFSVIEVKRLKMEFASMDAAAGGHMTS
jgi:hypothetical protein